MSPSRPMHAAGELQTPLLSPPYHQCRSTERHGCVAGRRASSTPWLAAEYYRDIGAAPTERQVWMYVESPNQISNPSAQAHFTVASRLTSFAHGWGRSDKVFLHFDDDGAARTAAEHLRARDTCVDTGWVIQNCCRGVRPLFDDEGPTPLVQFWVMVGDLSAQVAGRGVSVFKLHVRRPQTPLSAASIVWHLPMGRLRIQE